MKGWKNFSVMILALFIMMIAVPVVHAALNDTVNIEWVKVDGDEVPVVQDEYSHADNLKMERGEEFDIKVKLQANVDIEDLEVTAEITGDKYRSYRHDMTYDYEGPFDLDENDSDIVKLTLKIPEDLQREDDDDYYKLRIRVADKDSFSFEQTYQLTIDGIDDASAIRIDDFSFTPQDVVVGRAFTALVRVENLGDDSLDDLKVTVSVPSLNIQDTEYLDTDDEIDPDDFQTFEELLLRIPMDAKPGTYDVEVMVEFDKYQEVVETGSIKVVAEQSADMDEDQGSMVTATPTQEFAAGTSAIYPILIENLGKNAKTYAITVSGLSEWATYTLEPSSVTTINGKSKDTVLLTVTAKDDVEAGEKAFVVSVDTPEDNVQKALTANIVEGNGTTTSWGKVQEGLTIGLIILVIILIILGLIIGFSKLRNTSDKDEETQTYY